MNAMNDVAGRTEPTRLADLLRWLGTGAVALSGVVFLLQGLDDMDAVIRNWSYLALMGVLTASGVGARNVCDDPKGARLLLGLAVALVPVQFAQLGGMVHGLQSGASGDLPALFRFGATTLPTVAAVGAVTLLAAPLAAFAGFSVLVRPAARPLTWAFMVPNVLLVLPWRDSVAGFVVLGLLAALAPLIDARAARSDVRFATAEGRAVRLVLLIPLAIAAVRLGFHVEALAGQCALAGFGAVALAYAARHHMAGGALRELMYMISALMGSVAWSIWMAASTAPGDFLAAGMLLPTAGIFMAAARLSAHGEVYRGFAALFMAAACATLLMADGIAGTLLTLVAGVLAVVWGVVQRQREPVLAGAVSAAAAIVVLALEAWARVDADSWIALAVAGVVLVLCASFLERFGRTLATRVREHWSDPNPWV